MNLQWIAAHLIVLHAQENVIWSIYNWGPKKYMKKKIKINKSHRPKNNEGLPWETLWKTLMKKVSQRVSHEKPSVRPYFYKIFIWCALN